MRKRIHRSYPRHAYSKHWLKAKLGCGERLSCGWCEEYRACLQEYCDKAYEGTL
jgi:hypothetical protein